MSTPLVSVVIPSYNQAAYVGEAIQSVLNQTYQNFEIIVVNDASPDDTAKKVNKFNDPRIKLFEHRENLGLPAARNSGIRASSGKLIALLDADDIFHPEKLNAHVNFFNIHDDVGVTYNSRFELNHSAKTIRDLWHPPQFVGLADFVLGFPFSPSDMVIRREWLDQVGLFDESYINGGEDTDFPCRLALAGCNFARIDRALTYRRYHSGRRRKDLSTRLEDVIRALNTTFNDPRCPESVVSLRAIALKHHLMVLVFLAFVYEDTDLGKEYVYKLASIDPSILQNKPCELVEFLLYESVADDNIDHRGLLLKILDQLPFEWNYLADQFDWAIARGLIIKGTRAILWGRHEQGISYFSQAADAGAEIDEQFLRKLAHQLLDFKEEFGNELTCNVIQYLSPFIEKFGSRESVRLMIGYYSVNQAFRSYQTGEYTRVPREILSTIANEPSYLLDRGVLAILARSIAHTMMSPMGKVSL